jgi:CHAD domain-containing protein
LLERLAFEANRTAKFPNSDAVHDLRVAIRRFQQGLVTFKSHFPRKAAKRLRQLLKALLTAAGKLRDCDIAAGILSHSSQPGAGALQRHARIQRRSAEKALLALLKRASFCSRVSKLCSDLNLDTAQADFDPERVRALARSILAQLAQRFFAAGNEAAAHGSGKKLHAFRIQAKKFRYSVELFVPVYGAVSQTYLGEVKSIQSILGRVNDYRTVLSMAVEAGSGTKLQAALKRSEHRKIGEFREIWTKRFSHTTTTEWIQTLRGRGELQRPARKPTTSGTAAIHMAVAAGA